MLDASSAFSANASTASKYSTSLSAGAKEYKRRNVFSALNSGSFVAL
jgi:hypothetical protein